jgi:hypothetical protein
MQALHRKSTDAQQPAKKIYDTIVSLNIIDIVSKSQIS